MWNNYVLILSLTPSVGLISLSKIVAKPYHEEQVLHVLNFLEDKSGYKLTQRA